VDWTQSLKSNRERRGKPIERRFVEAHVHRDPQAGRVFGHARRPDGADVEALRPHRLSDRERALVASDDHRDDVRIAGRDGDVRGAQLIPQVTREAHEPLAPLRFGGDDRQAGLDGVGDRGRRRR